MKQPIRFVLALIAVLMLVCIVILARKYKETHRAEIAIRDQFNSALQSVAEIQDSLSAIVPQETRLLRLSERTEMGSLVTQSQKERMLHSIADLKESIRNTRERIRDLEGKLAGSQAEVASLQRIIENLKRSVGEKEAAIRHLTSRVDSLVVTVTGLQTDVRHGQETIAQQQQVIAEKGQEIEDKRQEIATIHYIVGTKKTLLEKGIIIERGGVLGLGKSVALSGTFNEADFTALDTDRETGIPIAGAEPQVLSGQSKSSYQLQLGKTESKLGIVDVAQFRKVKYLVIMVK